MPAPINPDQTEAQSPDDRLVNEAEALCNLLGDLGVIPAVNLSNGSIFVMTGENPKPGAIDVLDVLSRRAADDETFYEDVVSAVGMCGFYVSDAPAYNSEAKVWPADLLVAGLARAGLLVRHHYERGDGHMPMISFMPVPGLSIHANAHLLMKLVVDRFNAEPAFAADLTKHLIGAGRSQHSA